MCAYIWKNGYIVNMHKPDKGPVIINAGWGAGRYLEGPPKISELQRGLPKLQFKKEGSWKNYMCLCKSCWNNEG